MSEIKYVGIGELVFSDKPDDALVAPNLGSCVGVSAYDPVTKQGAMIHCLLPLSNSNPEKAQAQPCTFVDTGVVMMLSQLLARGVQKKNLVVAVAGGSNINDANNVFEIGKRNYTVLRKVLWKNNVLIKAEHVGDNFSRTFSLAIGSGEVTVKIQGETTKLV